MTILSRVARIVALPLLAVSPIAHAQTPPAAAVKPNNAIIPLPLNPIVPAAQRLCTAKTASGLGYTVLRPGTGTKPTANDIALVNYLGYLAATGAVFDQNMQSPLPIDQVIPGFSEALQTMNRTAVVRFCIPATLGYGAREAGSIPANSDLVFQVELLDFKTAAEVQAMNNPAAPPPAEPQPATPTKP
ncbi:FKBP-type peptidyl-prolyl cis-trans isomerase [Sphingomonas sp. Leaf10]|uniref:FKBP-type peptidyl-prolyl cis-trans isomerase n=1 Tax=Sphingomonas sp. Leaf10 TaxID=1735676 RepID=UPI0006F4A967|nr:FKBP-type peptidyl-prolyl cis-trans isomerase [Sphingomonas sp. Leaf10]KQM41332.1 peptidylprolyl isomerase [Sphingomonas sp. Leaf10]